MFSIVCQKIDQVTGMNKAILHRMAVHSGINRPEPVSGSYANVMAARWQARRIMFMIFTGVEWGSLFCEDDLE